MTAPNASSPSQETAPLQIGWGEGDLTPLKLPVLIPGQFYSRVAEGIADPLGVTALALASRGEAVVFVTCDLICVPDHLRDAVRERVAKLVPSLDPMKIILSGTHTHTGVEIRIPFAELSQVLEDALVPDAAAVVEGYIAFAADRIAVAVAQAWEGKSAGAVAFGLGEAVVARNRRWVDKEGISTMYGLNGEARERFRHIEGYEDHSLNLLATYDAQGRLSGIIVNLPSPSQQGEHGFEISADFWCETRRELRRRFGDSVAILPQCSAAGDLTSRLIFGQQAHERMLRLRGRTEREEIAHRIAEGVERVVPCLAAEADASPVLEHRVITLELPVNELTAQMAEAARQDAAKWEAEYEAATRQLEENPALRNEPRWYVTPTRTLRRMRWYQKVVERYEALQRGERTQTVEIHVVRLGEIAFASNPFEYYLDYGVQIKVRSPAIQTFLVQLAGGGNYVPSPRSVAGGGYGSVPASNPVGPEGGQILAEETIAALRVLFPEE
ncbi:MAG TPA: hypothetical protein VNQ90_21025 [Chthoniobacteraceae bacterium]|nr:hypothetical protein [Chthoniobacteraceae bacterium]